MAHVKPKFSGKSLPSDVRKEAKKEMNRMGEELVVRAELSRIFLSLDTMVAERVKGAKRDQMQIDLAQDIFVSAGERLFELFRK